MMSVHVVTWHDIVTRRPTIALVDAIIIAIQLLNNWCIIDCKFVTVCIYIFLLINSAAVLSLIHYDKLALLSTKLAMIFNINF